MILLEKEYGKEIDVWSLGCVFAELLGLIKDNISDHISRSPLFPGKSCFPLSPDNNASKTIAGYPCSNQDQLNMIFRIIGSPTEEDLSFISDSRALRYVQSFRPVPAIDIRELFPGSTNDEIDLLLKLVTFSPRKRITLDQALTHPYFTRVRHEYLEVNAEVQADFIFDHDCELNSNELRDLFRREISEFNNN